MTRLFVFLFSLSVLASCDDAVAPEATSAAPTADAPVANQNSPQVSEVKGLSFRVLVASDGQSALVGIPSQKGRFNGSDVEKAAQQVTGCSASIVPGEWAFLGDLKSFELSNLRANVRRPFPAWQVSLSC